MAHQKNVSKMTSPTFSELSLSHKTVLKKLQVSLQQCVLRPMPRSRQRPWTSNIESRLRKDKRFASYVRKCGSTESESHCLATTLNTSQNQPQPTAAKTTRDTYMIDAEHIGIRICEYTEPCISTSKERVRTHIDTILRPEVTTLLQTHSSAEATERLRTDTQAAGRAHHP